MTKPSRRSSVASALFRARPLRLALPALAVLVGFGLFVSGCGDDPAPTTPTPTTPTPTPTPPPAVPAGLAVASTGPDHIEWTWTAVAGATAYDVQVSNTAENDFAQNTQASVDTGTSHRAGNLPAETTRWARVRAKSANGESDWSDAVSGTTMKAPVVLTAPTGLTVADSGPRFIEWTWDVVAGATAYEVQTREGNANFGASDEIEDAPATASPKWRKTVEPETTHYLRVRAVAGTGADRVEGEWALAVEGESPIEPIAVPANLRVAAKGVDFIEWEWDRVGGATSYNVRLDLTSPYTFNPPSDTSPEITMTKWRKTGLDDGELVHAQVRANAGTSPNQRRGEWSQSVSTTTDERQPEPISTPTGLAASGETRTQVSLNWNDVTNAETYEVQQRVGSSGSWGNATCDESDDNEVEDSECTVTGLESGTAYQFRVRAVPVDDDDDLLTESAWSSPVTATTTGRATGGTGGGAGALNITWRSTQTTITWRWDQAGREVDFQMDVLDGVLDTAAPCEDRSVTWEDADFSNSHTESSLTASDARLLCVRTVTTDSDGDETYGVPSWSWAAAAPGNVTPAAVPAIYKDDRDPATVSGLEGETEALVWNATFADLPHFDYDIRYFVDEAEKDNDDWEAPASGAEQRACSAADLTEEISPSGAAGSTFTSGIDLEPYAAYRMCYRAVNDDGASNWIYNFTAPIHTRPIKPGVGQGVPRTSTNPAGEPVNNGDNFRVAWAVTTNANAPRADSSATDLLADYSVRMARSTTARAETAVRDQCQAGSSGNGFLIQAGTVSGNHIRPPSTASSNFNVWFRFPNTPDANSRLHYYLCVRTMDVRTSAPGVGPSPWVVSPGVTHGGSN